MDAQQIMAIKIACLNAATKYSNTIEDLEANYKRLTVVMGIAPAINP